MHSKVCGTIADNLVGDVEVVAEGVFGLRLLVHLCSSGDYGPTLTPLRDVEANPD